MKIILTALSAILLISQSVSASDIKIKDGKYVGSTDDGKKCYLTVNSKYGLSVGLFWKGAFGDGVHFTVKSSSQTDNILKVSGSADFATAKAKITMHNDGTPIEALMGVGALIQLGYDIDCKNLTIDNSN